jgi:hypothetical protein
LSQVLLYSLGVTTQSANDFDTLNDRKLPYKSDKTLRPVWPPHFPETERRLQDEADYITYRESNTYGTSHSLFNMLILQIQKSAPAATQNHHKIH